MISVSNAAVTFRMVGFRRPPGMNSPRVQRMAQALVTGKHPVNVNEMVLSDVFSRIQGLIDDGGRHPEIERAKACPKEFHRLPYFYVTAIVGPSREPRVFTMDKLISTAALLRASMPNEYEVWSIAHFMRAEFVSNTFEGDEDIGVYNLYKEHPVISWLVNVFYIVTLLSVGHGFLNYESSVFGMHVCKPYGSDVSLYKVNRGAGYAYVLGYSVGMNFSTKFNHLRVSLPLEVMDIHETLQLIEGYKCHKCPGVCMKPGRHLQTFPMVCVDNGKISSVLVDHHDSRKKGELRGKLEAVNQWV